MYPNGWPVVNRPWVLVCYRGNGSSETFRGSSQQSIYERMCSTEFIKAARRRGFVEWEMRQEAPHVVLS